MLPYVVRERRFEWTSYAVVAVGFGVVGGAVLGEADGESRVPYLIGGILTTIAGLRLVMRNLRREIILMVNRDGFVSGGILKWQVPWSQVAVVRLYRRSVDGDQKPPPIESLILLELTDGTIRRRRDTQSSYRVEDLEAAIHAAAPHVSVVHTGLSLGWAVEWILGPFQTLLHRSRNNRGRPPRGH
jgi:hypothetical protein